MAWFILAVLAANRHPQPAMAIIAAGICLTVPLLVDVIRTGDSWATIMASLRDHAPTQGAVVVALLVALWDPRRHHFSKPELDQAFHYAPTAQAMVGLDGTIEQANVAFHELCGIDDTTGTSLVDIVEPTFWRQLQSQHGEATRGRIAWLDCGLERNGTHLWVSAYGRLLHDASEQPRGYLIQFLDLSKILAARAEKTAAEYRFNSLFEATDQWYLVLDDDAVIEHANVTAARALGASTEALEGTALADLLPAHELDKVQRALTQLHADENNIRIERLRVITQERELVVSATLAPIGERDGGRCTLLSCQDITREERSLRALQQREAQFSRIFHASPDAIVIVRAADGLIMDFNAGLTRLLGYQREDLIGVSAREFTAQVDADAVSALLNELRERGECLDQELAVRDAFQHTLQIELSMRFIEIDSELCVLAIARDISDRIASELALKESERKFAQVFAQSPDGIVIISLADGTIYDANDAFVRSSGWQREELLDRPVSDFNAFHDPSEMASMSKRVTVDGAFNNLNTTFVARDGTQVPTLISGTSIEIDSRPYLLCIAKDVSQQRATEEQLKRSEERFRGTFENAPVGMLLVDTTGRIFQANRFVTELLDYTSQEITTIHVARLAPPDQRGLLKEKLRQLARDSDATAQFEIRLLGQSGLEIWANMSIVPQPSAQGEPGYFIVQLADITEMKRSQQQMERMAFYDTLTNLANRRLFTERLRHAIEYAQRHERSAALLYLDLDQFKRVNDSLGHEAGDELLRRVALRLKECVREEDTVARSGGDEFTILLFDINAPADAGVVADKLLAKLREPITIEGHNLIITTSIGITVIPADGTNATVLTKNADLAMYKAKERGRNNYQFFSEEMNTHSLVKLRTEYDLRAALEKEQLLLLLQPKVTLAKGTIVGAECLLRWQHPERGMLGPAHFIDIAEETGAIDDIGRWVIREACRLIGQLSDVLGRPVSLAVNLSPSQFRDPTLVTNIRRSLREAAVASNQLEIEITETMLMHDVDATSATLRELHALGIQIAVDDFGTGYSSLNYLKRFPIDTLKVDRSFVMDIPDSEDDKAITSAVIAMAHQLNMSVVAEGVETEAQMRFLAEQKCEFAQGYLFGKPAPVTEFIALARHAGDNVVPFR